MSDPKVAIMDEHPDQAPGRTITRSDFDYAYELHKGVDDDDHYEGLLRNLGISIIPDTEPTNAEHDRDWWVENANVNDAEDCEACEGDLCPVHYGISMGIDLMAKKIAALGADPELFALIPDPVKVPGGDNE